MNRFEQRKLLALLTRKAFRVSGGEGGETRYEKYSCKGPCKGKSYETTYEHIVSRYQTLVSSLPRETVFYTDDRKPNL